MLISTGLCCFAESLLLGSLLWFLGIMCLFTLPKPIQSHLESVPLVQVEEKAPGNLVQREAGSKNYLFTVVKSRRCKASRRKMKMTSHALSVLAWDCLHHLQVLVFHFRIWEDGERVYIIRSENATEWFML